MLAQPLHSSWIPLLKKCWLNVVRHFQRWSAIEAMLAECWSGISSTGPLLRQCWLNAGLSSPSLARFWGSTGWMLVRFLQHLPAIEAVLVECWSGIYTTGYAIESVLAECWSGFSSTCPLLRQCWLNAGPTSPALAAIEAVLTEYWSGISSIGPQLRRCWLNAGPTFPALARYWGSAGWMLVWHLQHWPAIEAVLAECWSVISSTGLSLRQCWLNAGPASPTLARYWGSAGYLLVWHLKHWPAIEAVLSNFWFDISTRYWGSAGWIMGQHLQHWSAIEAVLAECWGSISSTGPLLRQCWLNVGAASPALVRYSGSAGWMLGQHLQSWSAIEAVLAECRGSISSTGSLLKQWWFIAGKAFPALARYWGSASLMLVWHLQHWPTIEAVLAECCSGISITGPLLRQCWLKAAPASSALARYWGSAGWMLGWSGFSSYWGTTGPLLRQCWLFAGPASPALSRYWGSAGWKLLQHLQHRTAIEAPLVRYWGSAGYLLVRHLPHWPAIEAVLAKCCSSTFPLLRQCWLNAGPASPALVQYCGSAGWMLGQHLQSWSGIEAVLVEC